jgi:hypothetical protein
MPNKSNRLYTTPLTTIAFEDVPSSAFLTRLHERFMKTFDMVETFDYKSIDDEEVNFMFSVSYTAEDATFVRASYMQMEYYILGFAHGAGLDYEVILTSNG